MPVPVFDTYDGALEFARKAASESGEIYVVCCDEEDGPPDYSVHKLHARHGYPHRWVLPTGECLKLS